ncbi:MAG TPA: GNAT family N-acetyltransferase [Candidatus Acidoferrum sp.]|nr:GNAT family N-acetyltransferase [Candidatus Acidoferrum sp.]
MLETTRLRLMPWNREDWLQLKPITQDPRVMRYISAGQPWSDEQIQEFVQRQISGFTERGFCFWRLLAKDVPDGQSEDEMIGFCGLQPLPATSEIEIGWWLAPAWWGKGLATEAAREAMRDALQRVGLDRIVAVAIPENRASIHVMEKLGMRFERETAHRGFRVALYAINRDQYKMQQ